MRKLWTKKNNPHVWDENKEVTKTEEAKTSVAPMQKEEASKPILKNEAVKTLVIEENKEVKAEEIIKEEPKTIGFQKANKEEDTFSNATIIVNDLVSCEHYKKDPSNPDSKLVPFLDKVSFIVHKGDVLGISADNESELTFLIEILGNMRPYYSGYVKLSNLGVKAQKRMVLESIFYCDSHEMVYQDMTLLEHMMFISNMLNHDKKINYADEQKKMLDIIVACKLDDIVMIPIFKLQNTTKMVIAMLIACMSNSEKIIINATKYSFPQADVIRITNIFKYYSKLGKSIVLATKESKVIGMACKSVVFINKGQVKVNSSVDELYKRWDKVVCSIKCNKPDVLSDLIKRKYTGVTSVIYDDILYIKNYNAETIKTNDIYEIATTNDIGINFIRFNQGRVENAFNEIKETFNDLYE